MNERDALADLRSWRDEFARSHGFDLAAMVAALRAMDLAAGDRVVRGVPRPPVSTGVVSSHRRVANELAAQTHR